MKELLSLEDKVAIVTGGNGGLGKGIAHGFAAMGANIVIAARNQQKTADAEREIKEAYGVKVIGLIVDVTDEEEVQRLVSQTLEKLGRIDILVNNAGINNRKLPQDYQISEWDEVIRGNLRSAFLCSQAVYPAMKKVGGGKIGTLRYQQRRYRPAGPQPGCRMGGGQYSGQCNFTRLD
jgi:2-deoxy-D-gluconate 3-dehydrogenase